MAIMKKFLSLPTDILNSRGLAYSASGDLCLDGVNLPYLTKYLDSPSWVIGADTFKYRAMQFYQMLETSCPRVNCHFAVKSLDHVAILKILKNIEFGLDIVSSGELSRALHIGFPTHKIVFSGVGKTDSELNFALQSNIAQINIESLGELKRLNKIASQANMVAPIAIRINPDLGYGAYKKITTGNKTDKFGIPWNEILSLWPKITEEMPNIQLKGIAVHGGSQILDEKKFLNFYQRIAQLIKTWQNQGLKIDSLDCGGGFGIPYSFNEEPLNLRKLGKIIHKILSPLNVMLRFEPGRYISGPAGILISRVIEIKQTESQKFLILDAGMNDLLRPALYGAQHEILPLKQKENTPNNKYEVVGPICESSDFFRRNYTLPQLSPGDYIAILDTGAYGSVMSSSYNSHPLSPILLAHNGKWDIIRKRQTIEDILSNETLPDWIS
ncbi:diaminopimelate decarboxylase [Acetobacteraceae bacterium]|nr:diaminopimelate decarboxylase [Acetobacteraceae bacterium]